MADISGQCLTDACKQHQLVMGMTLGAFVLSGISVFLDFGDMVCYLLAPDAVTLKSGLNALSAILKFAAFAGILGSQTLPFTAALGTKKCYVGATEDAIAKGATFLVGFLGTAAFSAATGLVLAPVSAFWGGKLVGVPYIK